MMVQMFWDGILKLNHSLPNELFKNKKRAQVEGGKRSHVEVLMEKENVIINLC